MISEISITVIAVALIVFTFGLICIGSIFCCCALSSPSIFGALLCCGGFSMIFKKPDRRHDSYTHTGGHTYQNRNSLDSNAYSSTGNSSPRVLSQNDEVLLAEAYLVAPLVEARVINESSSTPEGILSNKRNFETEPGHVSIGGVNETEQKLPQMIFKDFWAAAVFIIQVVVIIYFAVQVSLKSMRVTHSNYEQVNGLGILVVAFGILGALATFMGTLCLTFVLRNSSYIIEGVMWMNIGVCAVGSVLCLASSSMIFAIILGALAAMNYWYLNSVRNRIAFASAVLSVACQAIKDNYDGTIISAYLLLIVQLGWFILWSIASYGISIQFLMIDDNGNQNSQFTGGQFGVLFLMLLSLHWGSEVVRTVLQTTVNGVIACWWFQPSRKAIVRGALFRSVTTSFGSVCFGSFIVSAIHTLRDVLRIFSKNGEDDNRDRRGTDLGDLLSKFADCILGLVERALTYFNKYAYCYVAGYGMGFIESAQKVTKLFMERGWTAIVNDNLISNALTFAVLGMTIITALLGTFSSLFLGSSLQNVGISDPMILLTAAGALMGFAVSIVLTNALSSGVAMVFVCMAENPNALKDHHPQDFYALTLAWSAFYPDNDWTLSNPNSALTSTSGQYHNAAPYTPQQQQQQQQYGQTAQHPHFENTGNYPHSHSNDQITAPYPYNWNAHAGGGVYTDNTNHNSHNSGNNGGGGLGRGGTGTGTGGIGGHMGGGYEYQRTSQSHYGPGPGNIYTGGAPYVAHTANMTAHDRNNGGLVEARLVSDSTTYSPMQNPQHVQSSSGPYGNQVPQQYQQYENVQQLSPQHVPHAHYNATVTPFRATSSPDPSAPPML